MSASPDTILSGAYSDESVGVSFQDRSRPPTKLDAVDSVTTVTGLVGSGRESQSSVSSHMDYSPRPINGGIHHHDEEQTSETSGAGFAGRGPTLPVNIPTRHPRHGCHQLDGKERSNKPISLSPAKSPSTKKCRSPSALRGSPMDRLAKKLGIKVR